MKFVFMGTPDFAAVILRLILESGRHEVAAVYTQPDRPAGRGQSPKASPVKLLALERGLPVRQPANFKESETRAEIAAFGADAFIVAAYGLILPQALLDMPRHGAINVHASLLPRWRGAAPIQRSIMAGDKMTGITIMQMEAGLDAGPMLMQRALAIGINDNAALLHDELAEMGGSLLLETLEKLESEGLTAIRQDDLRANYAAKLAKSDGFIDFAANSLEVHNRLRGATPWPGARAVLHKGTEGMPGQRFDLLLEEGRLLPYPFKTGAAETLPLPGTVLGLHEGLLAVKTADAAYGLARLRPAGGKSLSAADFANGYLKDGPAFLTSPE